MIVESVAPGHIRVDGRDVALGLLWQKRLRGTTIRQQALAAAGHAPVHDLYALVAGREQICFARSSGCHAARMLIGVLQIQTESFGTNWLAAFALTATPGPMWVVAMRDGDVYEDSVHETAATAHQTYLQLSGAPDWETCIAPAAWKIEDAEAMALEEVLDARPQGRLQPVNRVVALTPWLLGAAGLGIVAALLWTVVPAGIERLLRPPAVAPAIVSGPDHAPPWLNKPRIEAFAAHCIDLVGAVYIPYLGWRVAPITCTWHGQSVMATAEWQRTGGSYGRLRAAIRERLGADPQLDCAGRCATLTLTASLTTPALHDATASWPDALAETRLRERFHDLGVNLNMTLRALPGPDDQPATVRDSYHDLSLDVASGLHDHLVLLEDVPALVPEALTFTPATDRWLLTARIYHRESVS